MATLHHDHELQQKLWKLPSQCWTCSEMLGKHTDPQMKTKTTTWGRYSTSKGHVEREHELACLQGTAFVLLAVMGLTAIRTELTYLVCLSVLP